MDGRQIRCASTVAVLGSITSLLLSGCYHAAPAARGGTAGDVVNVGYGTQPRNDVTGSIASVDLGKQGVRSATRVEELLQGRVPGVSVRRLPGGRFSVRVRGTNSLLGSGEPLFVIDGVQLLPGSDGVSGVNPRDVARIEVLKDASATAIYGVRGANGVILIATRKGL